MLGYHDTVELDFIRNGQAEGPLAENLQRVEYDAALLRPVVDPATGGRFVYVKTGRMVRNEKGQMIEEREWAPLQQFINKGVVPAVLNASALTYQAWQRVDRAVIKATRERLQAWTDLEAMGTYSGFNGMGVTALIRDTVTEAGHAKVDMDTLSDDVSDAPLFTPDVLPLPIIHAGFKISGRRLAESRNGGMPLDTFMAEQCSRRCAETLEDMTIGMTSYTGLKIAQSQQVASADVFTNQGIYGLTNHPQVISGSVTAAATSFASSGAGGHTFINEVIALVESARGYNYFGPFNLYYSTTWDQYMNRDYYNITTSGAVSPTMTVRERLAKIGKITKVAMLDRFTTASALILVQTGSGIIRAVDGMDWTTVQAPDPLGDGVAMRVLAIKVPDIRSQFYGTSTSTRTAPIVYAAA